MTTAVVSSLLSPGFTISTTCACKPYPVQASCYGAAIARRKLPTHLLRLLALLAIAVAFAAPTEVEEAPALMVRATEARHRIPPLAEQLVATAGVQRGPQHRGSRQSTRNT